MPSTATITSFYTFTANTKARATQVNANFDIFRGHLLPISPSTQTASNNTYDLGSTEYRWRTGYFGSIDLSDSTSGGGLTIKLNGTTVSKLNTSSGFTTSAQVGDFARSSIIYSQYTTNGAYNILGSTLTIEVAGKPVEFKFCPADSALNTATSLYLFNNSGFYTGAYQYLHLIVDGVTLTRYEINWGNFNATATSEWRPQLKFPFSISHILSLSSGSHTVYLCGTGDSNSHSFRIGGYALFAKEYV